MGGVSTPSEQAERADLDARRVVGLTGRCTLARDILGGKGWSINRIASLGLRVPPAFVLPTENCRRYFAEGRRLSERLWVEVVNGVSALEAATGRTFGAGPSPLLLSVRSGAARSMPGMMDTVLNVGINEATRAALAAATGGEAFAADTHRRFVDQYRAVVLADPNGTVPENPADQLRAAIAAVFQSWESPRARTYRRDRGLDRTGGTAVVVQAMVFGNLDARSGTGVVFSRNPVTGAESVYGEWLAMGQGEDVVSGRHTPAPLATLAATLPAVHAELVDAARRLERDAGAVQDIEFTVEAGVLWLLQSRAATVRTGPASQRPAGTRVLASGEPASPGLATGVVVLDPDEAERRAERGEAVVLARSTTSPQDIHGMIAAQAIVTELGGATCHAAVVSRELGRPCVVGCGAGSVTALAGKVITVDGTRGQVLAG